MPAPNNRGENLKLPGMDHLTTGARGEDLARRYLEAKGYAILEHNWRWRRAEVDLIAKDGDALVIIEVKTRRSDHFGRPETFVDEKKQNMLAGAAAAYMEAIGHEWEVRFDVIAILLDITTGAHQLEHFPDAFFPGLH
jgi:putative endonuclease